MVLCLRLSSIEYSKVKVKKCVNKGSYSFSLVIFSSIKIKQKQPYKNLKICIVCYRIVYQELPDWTEKRGPIK